MTGPVVVGLDGSPASVTAAWWAAQEALDRHLPLLLLHSWTTQPLNVPIPQEALSKQRYGGQMLYRTETELLHRHPELKITTELVSEPAAKALLSAGETATMLVLGSRGHGSVASFLLGSISLHVLGLARCPAVTVRAGDPSVEEGWRHATAGDRGTVVVGVQENGSFAAPLLEFALGTARARGGRVLAVRALPPSSLMTHPHAMTEAGAEAWEAEESGRLAAALGPWREKFPDVPLTGQVVRGTAAQVLLSASTHGGLTVVGRRRHPSPATWKLGPVAHAALHHMPCPVAVVPHD